MNKTHFLRAGVLLNIALLWACHHKTKTEPLAQHPLEKWSDSATPLDQKASHFGTIENGMYYDDHLQFSLEIPDSWQVDMGGQFVGLQLRLHQTIAEAVIEIWKFEGIRYKPSAREDCIWAFSDKGLYLDWGYSRAVNVATCYPISGNDVIFVYLRHDEGNTWQLEAHVSRNNLVDGLHEAEKLLQQINWNDDEEIQKASQNPEGQDEN